MRLLVATGLFPPDLGGPATYSKLLCDELPQRGIEVSVLSFGEVRSLPILVRHFSYFLKVLGRSRDADIIYAQDPVSVGFPSVLASLIVRRRFFIRVAGDYAWEQGVLRFGVTDSLDEFVRTSAHPLSVRVLKWIERFTTRRAERVIVPSEYMRGIVHAWGVPLERIAVVYSSIEGMPSLPPREELRHSLGFDGKKVIMSAGRLVPWKGFQELINLMPELLARFPEALLLIAGDGPMRKELAVRAEALGILPSVRFTGGIGRTELFRYLAASDVFALCSTYEGLSHQLLESLSLGTPVVAFAIGGNPELIRSGEDGFLVPEGDRKELFRALTTVLADTHLADSFKAKGKEKASRFDSSRMIDRLITELR